MFVYKDRVHEVTTAGFAGTGPVQLNGAPASPAGRVPFSAIGNGNECCYLVDDGAGNWEVGIGTYSSGSPNTLSRDLVIDTSLGATALVNFSTGVKDVKCVVSAAHLPQSPVELTISGSSITLAQEFHLIDTEGDGASDVLDAIVFGPIREGQGVALMLAHSARLVYLAASSTIGLPCLLSSDWPTEFRRYGGKLWPLNDRILLDRKSGAAASYDFVRGVGDWAKKFELDISDMRPQVDGDDLWLRLRDAALGAFQLDAADYEHHVQSLDSSLSTYDSINSVGDSKIRLTVNAGNGSNEGVSGELRLYNPGPATSSNRLRGWLGWCTSAGVLRGSDIVGHYNGAQNAVDGMQLLFSSGGTSIAAGRAELWGFKR